MADIIFRYTAMQTAVEEIAGYSTEYTQAATAFETNILSAVNAWEGDSKEKFVKFITVPVNEYIQKTVPKIVTGLSEMLKANAEQMKKADAQIADKIPDSLGG